MAADPPQRPTPQQIKVASEEFDQGRKAAEAKNFEEAAQHFEAADRAAPSPVALKAAIKTRSEAKQPARAATLAALALARYPDDKDLASFSRGILEQFEKKLQKYAVACKPECELVVDNKLVHGEAALAVTLYLDPGKHTVAAGWKDDKTQSKDVTAKAGDSSSLSFAPPKEDKPAPSASAKPTAAPTETAAPSATDTEIAPAPKKGLPPTVAYVGIGLTVVLGGASAWSGLDAQSNPGPDKVKEQCVGLGEACPAYKDGRSRQLRTNVLLGVTGGVGLATVIVAAFLTDWKGNSESTSASARTPRWLPGISFDSGGAQLNAAGRF